jgi:dolichyl-diphosphooligosaccharide--protein glycosyltransferase
MRLVNQTLETGQYPYYSESDPLLNYPFGRSGDRAPLFNMMAISFSRFLAPFMPEVDAVGYAMQFVPALFGALLVFPVYFIGKTIYSKKAGLLAALFIAIIPIHLGSGHGSAYSLFDHDSFNLLLFTLTFLFLIKSIKEKDQTRFVLYAVLGGIPLAALSMTWVEARFLYVVIAVYAIVQMFIDIFTSKINTRSFLAPTILLFTGYIISLPVIMSRAGGYTADIPLFLCLAVGLFGLIYISFGKKRIPWTLSLPAVFGVAGIGLISLYFIDEVSRVIPAFSSLHRLSDIVFGSGIYGQKVSGTIAEAATQGISRTVMSFGPALYWMGWIGFLFLAYYYLKDRERRDYLFLVVVFIIDIWLTSISGRFLNDMVPLIALFAGISLCIFLEKVDYKQMLKDVKGAGGGIHGLRRGIKILHIFGVLFIGCLIIFPGAYLAFDYSVPPSKQEDIMGDLPTTGGGLRLHTEEYWVDALQWLSKQDTHISNPADRPAVISWWDYGFYEAAIGAHPTVADNFQDGIAPAANFHTASGEQEGVAVWAVRLIGGAKSKNNGKIPDDIKNEMFPKYFGNESTNLANILEDPVMYAPSYDTFISEEYGNTDVSLKVRSENAMYHDAVAIISNISDEKLTWFYHELQEATGLSIRYYNVEGYDVNIFNIFVYLADKGGVVWQTGEDDYFKQLLLDPDGIRSYTIQEYKNMSEGEQYEIQMRGGLSSRTEKKQAWYDSMVYRCYLGQIPKDVFDENENNGYALMNSGYYAPTSGLKHFSVEYLNPEMQYWRGTGPGEMCIGCPAVIIAKYYEGAFVNGSVLFNNNSVDAQVVVQKVLPSESFLLPIDHDMASTNIDGNFSLIAPAGDITIQIRRYPELGAYGFVMKSVVFNDTNNPEFEPITDDDAMRKAGSNYERILGDVIIEPASIEGYVYQDNDNNDVYNASVDTPLSDVKVVLYEIASINPEDGMPENYGNILTLSTDENGYYNTSNLMPGIYIVQASIDDLIIHEDYVRVYSGENAYDISKPKPADVKGTIYFDDNGDGDYDPGEEMNNVDVELQYIKATGDRNTIDSITSDDGSYSFGSLIPGNYILHATKGNDYEIEEAVSLMENQTTELDISIDYTTITVSGVTKSQTTNIENVTINFDVDNSVTNNTAIKDKTKSGASGEYSVDLMPGSYNVTAKSEIINESGVDVTYTYSGKLEVQIGEVSKTFDIIMTREEE